MNRSRPTLMVVDDEPGVLDSLHNQFRKTYLVQTFEGPEAALGALHEIAPSVVLSDQRMPGMSGVSFLREVKRLRPDATRLLFTGYADIKAVIDAINEGHVFRYLNKPWDVGEMETVVRQAAEHHDLLVERRALIAELSASNEKLQETNARLRESNLLKKAFIEVASHELNTPVAVILGMTDLWKMMLTTSVTPEAQATWLDRIGGAAKRLAGTVERMLKLLRADRFDEPIETEHTDLSSLLSSVIADLSPFLEARNQTADVRIAPELGSAEIDRSKIGDVLTNLIVNAIKFTPDGGSILIHAAPDGADAVRFRISDTGIGIGQADRAHLFEPFFTGYDTLHHSSGEYQYCKKGIGLGLSLVKAFVEMHGGSVDVTSDPGRGSTFGVTLPRKPSGPKFAVHLSTRNP